MTNKKLRMRTLDQFEKDGQEYIDWAELKKEIANEEPTENDNGDLVKEIWLGSWWAIKPELDDDEKEDSDLLEWAEESFIEGMENGAEKAGLYVYLDSGEVYVGMFTPMED